MKLFLDTGNIKDIETYCALGIIDGVTTNPSLMAKETGDPRAITKRICEIVKGPVSASGPSTECWLLATYYFPRVCGCAGRRTGAAHSARP